MLLLNSSYEPLHVCSWKRAVVLLIKGKAETVERNGKMLGAGWRLPLIIRLLYYVKIPHKETPLSRRNILHRDRYRCQYCGKRGDLTIDHVLPRSRGGKDTWDNVVTACRRCNALKGSRTPKEANMELETRPCRPASSIHFELSKHNGRISRKDYDRWRKYLYLSEE